MNKKKYFLIYLPCIFAFIIFVCFALVISNKTVQKNTYGQKINAKDTWKKVMADSANKSEISISVNKEKIKQIQKKAYMSDNLNLMIPMDIVKEYFDCAWYVYDNKRLVIEKGSNVAVMHIGEKKISFNDNEYSLQDKIIKKGDTLYVPETVFTDYFKYKYKWNSELNAAYFTDTAIGNNYLPKRYSYIDKKRSVLPSNQGNMGTCWAFATMTALETSLMPEETYDFSENNLIYNNTLGEDIQDGGDYMMSMAYLMAWKGPVLEKDDPYGSKRTNKQLKPVKHVQEAQIIGEKDYKQIKEMVYKYGGVESSMYMSMNSGDASSVYYNESEYAYCYKGRNKPNHDVVIIGWDDNFPKELFNDESVEENGAFICINSWGRKFGYNGVFYVSYYDDCIGTNNVCYTKVENTDNYNNIYQSDLCGWTGSMGFDGENTAYFANVYKAKTTENIQAVGFYGTNENIKYEVFVCENYKNTNSLSERNHIAASGGLKNKGYYTINLDKKYKITKNKKFAVIVKVTNQKQDRMFKIIPVEMENSDMEGTVDLTDGEGYFSAGGLNWKSAENEQCNICLKAYTN